ncbi:MAG: NFACT family protein [Clostridiales bacterium]|jgi:predicted ribosome quality control (RQC) complex YloA/Tae2 family protein|nr:NFACT family protein [Clostridiales bacterium]
MTLDGVALHALKHEFERKILDSRVDKIYQPNAYDVFLRLRGFDANFTLFLSCNPAAPRLHLTQTTPDNPPSPPAFCMLLRKHLKNGKITAIDQPDFERVLDIHIEGRSELGDMQEKRLIIEIMGRHSNIILVSGADCNPVGRVLGSARHVDLSTSGKRVVFPGAVYEPPPSQGKKNPLSEPHLQGDPAENYTGISRATADFILRGNMNFHEYLADRCTHDVSDEIESYFSARTHEERKKALSAGVLKFVSTELQRAERKRNKLSQELETAKSREEFRVFGELITANIYRLQEPTSEKISLLNYYTDEQVEIPMNTALSYTQNAAAYYKKYNKMKTAETALTRQLALVQDEIEYLASVQQAVSGAAELNDAEESRLIIAEIQDELAREGYKIRGKALAQDKRKQNTPRVNKVEQNVDYELYMGKNNLQNDYLTLKFARGADWWFHAQKIPGSHVILRFLRTPSPETQRTAMEHAATVAAANSKARNSGKIAVDYCLAKTVKKPRHARPGMVIYTDFKTIIASTSS